MTPASGGFRWGRRSLFVLAAVILATGGGGALHAGDADSLSRGFKHNVDQPIEISADTMEVKQDEKLAFFSGTVDAVQGDMHLQSDVLEVYYRPKGEGRSGARTPFSRITASGNVKFTTSRDTATGDWATYDVDGKIITLGGTVVLRSGDNVIEGARLVLDLEAGRSRMESRTADSTGDGRVRATFIPESRKAGAENE